MAKIVIDDLPDNMELDQEAMSMILGGSISPQERMRQRLQQAAKKPEPLRLMDLARSRQFGRRPAL